MGKVYKNKKGSSCKMCKPHKNGWAPKKSRKVRGKEEQMEREVKEHFCVENGGCKSADCGM
jgi:hypothetical protein